MTELLKPSYPVLALLFATRFVVFEVVLILALLRVVVARGPARAGAALAACAAGAATLAVFAPALGLAQAGWYSSAARALTWGGGITLPLAISALFAVSACLPGAHGRWIDALHGLLVAGLLALWLITRVA